MSFYLSKSFDEEPPVVQHGTVRVRVLGARGFLPDTDAYVKLAFEEGVPKSVTTKPVKHTSRPVWNEEFVIDIQKRNTNIHEMWVHVKDANIPGGMDIGYCKFAYGDETLFPNGKTVSLRDQKIDHDENVTTETIDLDITVVWEEPQELIGAQRQ